MFKLGTSLKVAFVLLIARVKSEKNCATDWELIPGHLTGVQCTENFTKLNFKDRDTWIEFRREGLKCESEILNESDNRTTYELCYPLTNWFLSCHGAIKRVLHNKEYTVMPNGHLLVAPRNFLYHQTVPIGSYNLFDNSSVETCESVVSTCQPFHNLSYDSINHNKNEVFIIEINQTVGIDLVQFQDSNLVNLCYPLSEQLLQCPESHLQEIIPSGYVTKPNSLDIEILHFSAYKEVIKPGDYILLIIPDLGASVVICNKSLPFYTLFLMIRSWVSLVSFICLNLAIFVNCINLRQNINKLAIQLHATCLMITTGFHVAVHNLNWNLLGHWLSCSILRLMETYLYMVAFFWLQVMCVNLWLNITEKRASWIWLANMSSKKLIVIYSVYAWIIPAIIDSIPFILGYNDPLPNKWLDVPSPGCVSFTYHSVIITSVLPEIYCVIVNITFILLTMRHLNQMAKDSKLVNEDMNKKLVAVYIKLLITAGICLLLPKIFFIVDPTLKAFVVVASLAHFQGILVFIIHVCKKDVFTKFQDRISSKTKFKPNMMDPPSNISTINMKSTVSQSSML